MEKPCLNDKNEYPDDKVLSGYLGEVVKTWTLFNDFIKDTYPSFSGEWRFYNDGKNWLYKVLKKKKTICWVSIYHHMFKTTFYFPDRAEDLITTSGLNKEYIEQFINGKRYGKTRGLTIEIKEPAELDATKILIEIKEKLK
jgi:hypothetical protein